MLDLIEVRRPRESARAINVCCATTPCTIWLSPYFTVLWHGSNNSRFWVPLLLWLGTRTRLKGNKEGWGLFNSQQGRKTTSLISNVPLPRYGAIYIYMRIRRRLMYIWVILSGELNHRCCYKVDIGYCPILKNSSEAVYTRNFFSTACRTACKHAFRFLRVLPEAVSTRHLWLWQTLDDVYTPVFLGVRGNTLRCPRTKGTAVSEWVHSFVDFCLIPLSTTCSVEVPGTNL